MLSFNASAGPRTKVTDRKVVVNNQGRGCRVISPPDVLPVGLKHARLCRRSASTAPRTRLLGARGFSSAHGPEGLAVLPGGHIVAPALVGRRVGPDEHGALDSPEQGDRDRAARQEPTRWSGQTCPGRESNPLKTDLQSVTLAALSPGRSRTKRTLHHIDFGGGNARPQRMQLAEYRSFLQPHRGHRPQITSSPGPS